MGSRLLNGSPQLSVRVKLLPLILTVLSSTVTSGTIAGIPIECSSIYLNTQLQYDRCPDYVIMLVLILHVMFRMIIYYVLQGYIVNAL